MAADASSTELVVMASGSVTPESSQAVLQANGVQVLTVPIVVVGAPGAVDTSFAGGFVIDTASVTGSAFNAVAVDGSGRVVAGGTTASGHWLLRRYGADGTLDSVFDANADSALPTSGSLDAVAIDPSTGHVICVGTSTSDLTIAVLEDSGAVAGDFNSGSPFQLTAISYTPGTGTSVVMDSTGRLIVAGEYYSPTEGLLLAPMRDTGNPGGGSVLYSDVQNTAFTAVALSGAAIVTAGTDSSGAVPVPLVERFDGGAHDPGFGMQGSARGTHECESEALVVRPGSGAIFVTGTDPGAKSGCFAQWSAAGTLAFQLDGTNGAGMAFTYWGAAPMGDSLDRVYVVGSGGAPWTAELGRILVDGGYDSTFGTDGRTVLADTAYPPSYTYTLKALAVQTDGRVVIAGARESTSGTYPAIARLWP